MEKDTHNDDWHVLKEKLKEKYPALTDTDFEFDNEEKQIMHLVTRLGKSKQEMRNEIQKMK